MDEAHAFAEGSEVLARPSEGLRVLVDADHAPSRRAAAQDLRGVAAQAESAVDVKAARTHREKRQRFLEQDGR